MLTSGFVGVEDDEGGEDEVVVSEAGDHAKVAVRGKIV